MAIFLLLLSIAAVGGAVRIVYLLFGPTGPWFAPAVRPSYAAVGVDFPLPAPVVEDAGGSVTMVDTLADFLEEDAVAELPAVANVVALPPATPAAKAQARAAEGTPAPAPAPARAREIAPIPSIVPRLGVSAPQKGRHLAPPPPRTLPSLPRTRSARGSTPPTSVKIRPAALAAAAEITITRVHPDLDTELTIVDEAR